MPTLEIRDPEVGCAGDGLDDLHDSCLFRLLEDSVEMDGAASTDRPKCVRQELKRGMGQIQDHAVDESDLPQNLPGVALSHRHSLRPVRRDVRSEQFHGGVVCIRGMDFSRPPLFCNQDRVRAHAREGIGDDFTFVREVRNPLSLGG